MRFHGGFLPVDKGFLDLVNTVLLEVTLGFGFGFDRGVDSVGVVAGGLALELGLVIADFIGG